MTAKSEFELGFQTVSEICYPNYKTFEGSYQERRQLGEEKEKKFFEEIGKESDKIGLEIQVYLETQLKRNGWLVKTEKVSNSDNDNRFDVVAGKEINGEKILLGFEIKGDSDNFTRLATQLTAYFQTFDKTYLVLHKKEKPDWLSHHFGTLHLKGEQFFEKETGCCRDFDFFNVSNYSGWGALMEANGLGRKCVERIKKSIETVWLVRKTILFNRFFGETSWDNRKMKYLSFFPFTKKEKELLFALDWKEQVKEFYEKTKDLEDKFTGLRLAIEDITDFHTALTDKQQKKLVEQ